MHNHSQVIPSAAKTKVDKIKAIKLRKEKKKNNGKGKIEDMKGKGGETDEDDEVPIMDSDEEAAAQKGSEDDDADANYYKENIFNKEDYYLYRAMMLFYCGEFEKSIMVKIVI
jgi:hypothetical protein